MLLRDPLEAHGYEIIEAENGEQALQKVEQRPPDVILLDVMMPQMDGFEVCRRLKKDALTAHIPILMVTALSERMERMMGIAAGASDFLSKPVDLQELTLRVNHRDRGGVGAPLVAFPTPAPHIGPDQVVPLLNEICSGFDLGRADVGGEC